MSRARTENRWADFSDDEIYLIQAGIMRIEDADPEDRGILLSELELELRGRNLR